MTARRTLLERLMSFLRGQHAAARGLYEDAGDPPAPDTPLALEWATYQTHKQELLHHEGQWVVIHGAQILGIRASYEEALRLGYEQAGYVNFLTHQILANEPVDMLPPQVV